MNLELEKKVQAYEERIKELEEKYLHVNSQLDKFQALMWDVENQNCENEDRFKKIAEAASSKFNNPPTSFYSGKSYPWKLGEWNTHYEEDKEDEWDAPTDQAWGSST